MRWKSVWICVACAAVKLCLIGPVAVFQSRPCELVLEVRWVHWTHFCAGKWGPNIQISCLTLSLFAHYVSTWQEHSGDLSPCWPFGKEQMQATPPFAFLVKLDHCRSISFGIRECWRFLGKCAGSEPWEHDCERQGQAEGRVPKSYVTLDKSRLRSCDNERRVVHRSNNFLRFFFFYGFCFVVVCRDLFVVFWFFSFLLCKCLIKVHKRSLCLTSMGKKMLSADGQVNSGLFI